MDFHLFHDWIHLLLRWGHFLAGIMWIGSSLYFVWMDNAFEKLLTPIKGVEGELYMVHGGNFYYVQKRKFGAGEMPKNLHWFKWEATLTWITGFILLVWVYYFTNGAYLTDPKISDITPLKASLLGMGVLVGGWFIYDGLYRSPLTKSPWVNAVGLALIGAVIFWLSNTFSGRGAFIHIGAMFGTMMVLNVWVHILPNQKAIIAASESGIEPDYTLGLKAKRRSMHNSYMTLPVLFIMISNHFPMTFSHPQRWLILILMIALGAFLRHFMITLKKTPLLIALLSLATLMYFTKKPDLPNISEYKEKISYTQIQTIIHTRCLQCHATRPTDDEFTEPPLGVIYEDKKMVKAYKDKIYDRVVVQKDMPFLNKTHMTDEERNLMGAWIRQGAPIDE